MSIGSLRIELWSHPQLLFYHQIWIMLFVVEGSDKVVYALIFYCGNDSSVYVSPIFCFGKVHEYCKYI